jgi:hypothetical protein
VITSCMVLKSVFSILLFLNAYACSSILNTLFQPNSSGTLNSLMTNIYIGAALISLALVLYYMYSFSIGNQNEKEKARANAINFLFGFLILLALPIYEVAICQINSSFFNDNSSYVATTLSRLENKTIEIRNKFLLIHTRIAEYEAKANTPYTFSVLVPKVLSANCLLTIMMMMDDPSLGSKVASDCVIISTISHFPDKPKQIHAGIMRQISNDLGSIYFGFQIHKIILQFISTGIFMAVAAIGVMLRFIPGLRKAGDVAIAFGFGMHLIYPFVYSLFFSMYNTVINKPNLNITEYSIEYESIFKSIGLEYYHLAVDLLFIITIPNLALGAVAVFASNAYKTFDILS